MLAPGQCQTVTVPAYAGVPTGPWYLAAVVDSRDLVQEFIEDNNTHVGSRIGFGERPDFVVTSITAPASAQPGQSFSASVRVCNQGTMEGFTNVELYLSEDTVITPASPSGPGPDFLAGSASVGNLAAGQCQTVTVSAYVPSTLSGAPYVGAVVDSFGSPNNELIEDNNSRTGARINLQP
jgi:hypothetical protein